jgi:hypothetical protein
MPTTISGRCVDRAGLAVFSAGLPESGSSCCEGSCGFLAMVVLAPLIVDFPLKKIEQTFSGDIRPEPPQRVVSSKGLADV